MKIIASVTWQTEKIIFLLIFKESLDIMFKKIECSKILYIYEIFERHIFLIIT